MFLSLGFTASTTYPLNDYYKHITGCAKKQTIFNRSTWSIWWHGKKLQTFKNGPVFVGPLCRYCII